MSAVIAAALAVSTSALPASAATTYESAKVATFDAGVQSANPSEEFVSVSCASAGNCTAAGNFYDVNGDYQAFTQTSVNGVWGNAVPATFAAGVQSVEPDDRFFSVSCASAGNCTAAGYFKDSNGRRQAFTQTSVNGVWATAAPATFDAGVQNARPGAEFRSVSCVSAGNCTAAGWFADTNGDQQSFTQTSVNGVWANGVPTVFDAGVQNALLGAQLFSVSCASAGNCTAAGYFNDVNNNRQAFTQTSVNGVWGNAVPATFAAGVQNANPRDQFYSVSCASAGNCTAVGYFNDVEGDQQAFMQSSVNGVWGNAVPATFAAGVQYPNETAFFNQVSCASAGNCTAAGSFRDANFSFRAFTQTSVNGVWGNAVPATFDAGVQGGVPDESFYAVSCASAGSCTAAGFFQDANGTRRAFTQTSVNGVWGNAVPATFDAGVQNDSPYDTFRAVSCVSPGNCTAAGAFRDVSNKRRAFTQRLLPTSLPPVLPPTGVDVDLLVVVAALLVVAGTAFTVRRRRRSEATTA